VGNVKGVQVGERKKKATTAVDEWDSEMRFHLHNPQSQQLSKQLTPKGERNLQSPRWAKLSIPQVLENNNTGHIEKNRGHLLHAAPTSEGRHHSNGISRLWNGSRGPPKVDGPWLALGHWSSNL
jgi:hypothetical protein